MRAILAGEPVLRGGAAVGVVDEGKNAWVVRQVLDELGLRVVEDETRADVLVIGTLSPGPMMDAWERRRGEGRPVLRPWSRSEPASLMPV